MLPPLPSKAGKHEMPYHIIVYSIFCNKFIIIILPCSFIYIGKEDMQTLFFFLINILEQNLDLKVQHKNIMNENL